MLDRVAQTGAEWDRQTRKPQRVSSGWPLPLPLLFLWWGRQFPLEILGQFANGHRLKDGMPQDPLLTRNDDPWAGWR